MSRRPQRDPRKVPYAKLPLTWDEDEDGPPPVKVELPPRVMATFRLLHITLCALWLLMALGFMLGCVQFAAAIMRVR